MEISPTLTGPLPGTGQTESQNTGVISSDFETFLKMLTVQMQNQDPSEPIKSEDYAVQLATFSGVEQQVRTNDLIKAMGDQLGLMGMSQMAGWVGMEARAPVSGHFDGNPITIAPEPPVVADRVDLLVKDQAGNLVQRMPISTKGEILDWAGISGTGSQFADGLYTFEIESFNNGATLGTKAVDVYATIAEARLQAGQTFLVTRGGTEIPASAITALRDPSLGT